MKKLSLSLLAFVALFAISCKKESSNNNQSTGELKGTWNLVNFDIAGETSSELSSDDMSVKAVILFDYLTVNNKGTITIDDSKMTTNDVSYDVTGTVNMKQYLDGVFMGGMDSTLNISMPASSSTTEYVRVGADSLYCANGSFIHVEGSEDMISKPAGIKYRFDGDKLIMTVTQKTLDAITEDGVTQEDKTNITGIVTFKK